MARHHIQEIANALLVILERATLQILLALQIPAKFPLEQDIMP
jgi:hypothetical protein